MSPTKTVKPPPTGIRNNNPGNIKRSKDRWQGLKEHQTHQTMFQFETPEYGIRALALVLITYQDRRLAEDGSAIDTVAEIISRWAPAGADDNQTAAYIDFVCRRVGVDKDQPLDLHDYYQLRPLVEAIIHFENGQQPYVSAQIDRAMQMAGVPRPGEKSTWKSGVANGARIAITGGTLTTVTGVLAAVEPAMPMVEKIFKLFHDHFQAMMVVMGLIFLIGGALVAYGFIKKRNLGLV